MEREEQTTQTKPKAKCRSGSKQDLGKRTNFRTTKTKLTKTKDSILYKFHFMSKENHTQGRLKTKGLYLMRVVEEHRAAAVPGAACTQGV